MSAKLSPALPDGDRNAIGPAVSGLVNTPHQTHVAIIVFDCKRLTTDMDTGDVVPTARIRRLEVVDPEDYLRTEIVMRRAIERRMGASTLPGLDDELAEVFHPADVTGLRLVDDFDLRTASGVVTGQDDTDDEEDGDEEP